MADLIVHGMEMPHITNGDRIRAMSDEELAVAFLDGCDGRECPPVQDGPAGFPRDEAESMDQCYNCYFEWLRSPAATQDNSIQ